MRRVVAGLGAAAVVALGVSGTGIGVAAASVPESGSADPFADDRLIDHVVWTDTRDGRRLMIFPTLSGRRDFAPPAGDRAWQEVLEQAPDANTPGMIDQFMCHWHWARVVESGKTSWNLEPWRPVVGYPETVAALCNPGAPENG
ncbi:DUF2599 domain-containing protein [Nocardia terpenica]|uniref:DUF2599 domain-containing protein n=1 Tax=Nocardia terpenica TaxID=455432 RepID=A0A164MLT0_9NOCA|nr:DUF2599 domain-containing protein [Nocardia terpenica]KZM73475.1 hypothetical protein AWN90_33145 [Nocardia terpenica]NQE87338.1 DUF2599 domain-containing protein [Nocardia terpenica]